MGTLLIRDLAQAVTPGGAGPLRGDELRRVTVTENAYIFCVDGVISSTGRMRDLRAPPADVEEIDGRGCAAIPGLIDCHTHPAFAGYRAHEFALRAGGATYEELLAAGGGILSTTRASREAGEDGLRAAVRRHRGWMRSHGTTRFEGKSGYGLDRETELAQLRAIRAEGGIPTFLGAHALPPEHRDADAYIDFLVREVMPHAAALAEAADVFVEQGAFNVAQARRYLLAAREHGLALRLHGDQLTSCGAVELAVELGARSIDHLEQTGPNGVAALAGSDVTAVLLPVAALTLGKRMPPARDLVDAGAIVALATDFNPGSAFCESLPAVCTLACTQLGLTPEEALSACTVNAAHVLGRADRLGRLAPGQAADVVLLESDDWRWLAYHFASDLVGTVVEAGMVAWSRV